MRLIDADALMPNAEYKGKNDFVSARDIANAPTIDAVPVVRCKDCFNQPGCQFAQYQGNRGYCSLGERRES